MNKSMNLDDVQRNKKSPNSGIKGLEEGCVEVGREVKTSYYYNTIIDELCQSFDPEEFDEDLTGGGHEAELFEAAPKSNDIYTVSDTRVRYRMEIGKNYRVKAGKRPWSEKLAMKLELNGNVETKWINYTKCEEFSKQKWDVPKAAFPNMFGLSSLSAGAREGEFVYLTDEPLIHFILTNAFPNQKALFVKSENFDRADEVGQLEGFTPVLVPSEEKYKVWRKNGERLLEVSDDVYLMDIQKAFNGNIADHRVGGLDYAGALESGSLTKWLAGTTRVFDPTGIMCEFFSMIEGNPGEFETKGAFDHKPTPSEAVDKIMSEMSILFTRGKFYIYNEDKGVWEKKVENSLVENLIDRYLGSYSTGPLISSTLVVLRARSAREIEFNTKNVAVLSNVTYDFDEVRPREHRRDDYCTQCRPFAYDPDSTCEPIDDFLNAFTCGDEEKKNQLLDYMAYAEFPNNELDKFLLLLGTEAGNGKSTFCKLMEAYIGAPNTAHIPMDSYGEKFAMVLTSGKRLLVTEEPCKKDLLGKPGKELLKMTSGCSLHLSNKGKDEFDEEFRLKPVVTTNEMLDLGDIRKAFERRAIIIECEAKFRSSLELSSGENLQAADTTLIHRLVTPENLSGLFNLVLGHYKRLRRRQTEISEAIQKGEPVKDASVITELSGSTRLMQSMRGKVDPIYEFFSEEFGPGTKFDALQDDVGEISSKRLYSQYDSWLYRTGNKSNVKESDFRESFLSYLNEEYPDSGWFISKPRDGICFSNSKYFVKTKTKGHYSGRVARKDVDRGPGYIGVFEFWDKNLDGMLVFNDKTGSWEKPDQPSADKGEPHSKKSRGHRQ